MEKILYTIWKPADRSPDAFRDRLLDSATELQRSGACQIRICVADSGVEAAAALRQASSASVPDGILTLWVDTAIRRSEQEKILAPHCARYFGYLVSESEPIVNREHRAGSGERTPGMNQLAFLQRPPRLTYEQWIQIWHHSHAQIAIDTQSTFGYRQNVVVRPLTEDAPPCDAVVEENFPAEAMTSPQVFFAADGDEALYQRNLKAMMESCARFIDFDRIDVVPSSEYLFD